MKLLFLFLCSTFSLFAQEKQLEVKINSITTKDVNYSNRMFYINYQIENKTKNPISFFLIPNALIAHAASSLTLFTVYKIYQNGKFEDMDGPFFEFENDDELEYHTLQNKNSEDAKRLLKTIQDREIIFATKDFKEYKDKGGISDDFKWIYNRAKLLNNIIVLNPFETKKFTIKTIWNRNRFIKNDDLEYYLNENDDFEIELILDLKTNLFYNQLTKEDIQRIFANPNFINGEFVSNKYKLNFDE